MICRMSWSCLRSSPCLKMTGYMAPSSALKISLAGIRALWHTRREKDPWMMYRIDTRLSQDRADWIIQEINWKQNQSSASVAWISCLAPKILQLQRRCESDLWGLKLLVLYLEERGSLRDDAPDPDLRLQRKRNGLYLRKIHLLVVSQQSLQPLRLQTHRDTVNTTFPQWRHKTTCVARFTNICTAKYKNKYFRIYISKGLADFCTRSNSVHTFFLRFPLSLCTAFISCTSLSTNVCWAANSERITLTLLSPWREEDVCVCIKKRKGHRVVQSAAEPNQKNIKGMGWQLGKYVGGYMRGLMPCSCLWGRL